MVSALRIAQEHNDTNETTASILILKDVWLDKSVSKTLCGIYSVFEFDWTVNQNRYGTPGSRCSKRTKVLAALDTK